MGFFNTTMPPPPKKLSIAEKHDPTLLRKDVPENTFKSKVCYAVEGNTPEFPNKCLSPLSIDEVLQNDDDTKFKKPKAKTSPLKSDMCFDDILLNDTDTEFLFSSNSEDSFHSKKSKKEESGDSDGNGCSDDEDYEYSVSSDDTYCEIVEEQSDCQNDKEELNVLISYKSEVVMIVNLSCSLLHSLLRVFPSTMGNTWKTVNKAPNLRYYKKSNGQVKDYLPNMLESKIEQLFVKHIKKALKTEEVHIQMNLMYSKFSKLQMPHVDFDWKALDLYGNKLYVGFFPLTCDGMELVYWTKSADTKDEGKCYGKHVKINYQELLILPGKFPHAGGFYTGADGNPRVHLYIATGTARLPVVEENRYRKNSGPLFSKKFVHNIL